MFDHMDLDFVAIVCMYIANSLFALCWFFQICKIIKIKKTDDISLTMLVANITGIAFFMVYAIHFNVDSMYIPSSFSAFFLFIIISVVIWNRIKTKKSADINKLSNVI